MTICKSNNYDSSDTGFVCKVSNFFPEKLELQKCVCLERVFVGKCAVCPPSFTDSTVSSPFCLVFFPELYFGQNYLAATSNSFSVQTPFSLTY